MGNFWFFKNASCEVIVRYTRLNLLEHEWIKKGIRKLETQIGQKKEHWSSAKCYWFLKKKKSARTRSYEYPITPISEEEKVSSFKN